MNRNIVLVPLSFLSVVIAISCRSRNSISSQEKSDNETNLLFLERSELGTLDKEACQKNLQGEYPDNAFPIQLWKIKYKTKDPKGNEVIVSGLQAKPANLRSNAPWFSYQHGTVVEKINAPSQKNYEGVAAACTFASQGVNFVAADYIGLGDSQGPHPYLHAATERGAAIDLLKAVTLNSSKQSKIRVFLAGSSQGGHSTFAMQKELESNSNSGMEVLGSVVFSGAFELSRGIVDATQAASKSPVSALLASYILTSYQDAYGDIWNHPSDVFQLRYLGIPGLIRLQNFNFIKAALFVLPTELLQKKFIENVKNDESNTFRKRLKENDVHNWAPRAKTQFVFTESDEVVPANNSVTTHAGMLNLGGNVEIMNLGSGLNHKEGIEEGFRKSRNFIAERLNK